MSTCKKGVTIKELYSLFGGFNHRDPEFFNPLMVYDQNRNSYWYAKYIDCYEEDDGTYVPIIFLSKKEDINPDPEKFDNLKFKMVDQLTIIKSSIISLSVTTVLGNYIGMDKGDCEIPLVFGDGSDDIYYIKGAILVKKSSYVFGKYLPTFELIVDR